MTTAALDRPVRVRFCPAPSGDLHVGNVRTALYNWLLARRHGGTFVFRIEDTDATRATDEAYHAAMDVLRWLGLDWDEGPEVGGPHGPYRQSERFDIYADVVTRLRTDGHVYPCYCTADELTARRELAAKEHRTPGYDGRCRELTAAQVAEHEREGRLPVMRFRMPDGATTFADAVRGDITIEHRDVPDFTLTRSNGHPLYMLAATVDDVLMELTHIVRGEDLIAATPRQMAMYAAMGVPRERFPSFAHLPLIVGDDHKPLSKRNGEVSIAYYRRAGFTPEAMCNYLALLGWSMSGDRELFSLAEATEAFSLDRVSRNPARFDVKKLEAINGDHIRRLGPEDLTDRLLGVLAAEGLVSEPATDEQRAVVVAAAPLVQTRLARLTEVPELLRFLLVADADFAIDPTAAAKTLVADAGPWLSAAADALEALPAWETAAIEAALKETLVDGLGLKPRVAFAPVRLAVTGRPISPPLYESLELLGRDRTLARLRAAGSGAGGW